MKPVYFLILSFLVISLISCDTEEEPFEEPEQFLDVPELYTYDISYIDITGVQLHFKVTDKGSSDLKEVGVVISFKENPTVQVHDSKVSRELKESGEYEIFLRGLPKEETKLYIRPYAINDHGVGYGNEVSFSTVESKTFNGDVLLSTQEEVIQFGKNKYSTINGNLRITGSVTDLSPLTDLMVINSSFQVERTDNLKNFRGLENLKYTGVIFPNGFTVRNNKGLIDFTGLSSLEVTRGYFYVMSNENLVNLKGLDNFVIASAGSLRIEDNPKLTNLSGLEKLQFIGADLALVNNILLTDISALQSLHFVYWEIIIGKNTSLPNLRGLESMNKIDKLILYNNDALHDLEALKSVDTLNFLRLEGNANLRQLPLFQDLVSIEGLEINYGGALQDLSGLANIRTIKGLRIFHSNIQSLEGLSGLNEVGEFMLYENPNLKNLSGLENLHTVRNGFNIYSNESLTDLNGLQGLAKVGNLGISLNNSLVSLEGLQALKETEVLHISHNYLLNDITALQHLERTNSFTLEGNDALSSLPVFDRLEYIGGLTIGYHAAFPDLRAFENLQTIGSLTLNETDLKTLEGLKNLKEIRSGFSIYRCTNLLNLKGLENVTSIGNGSDGMTIAFSEVNDLSHLKNLSVINGDLIINTNFKLKSLEGLNNVSEISKNIYIFTNKELADFCALTSLIKNSGFSGEYIVHNNMKNPTIAEMENGNCR